jgi:hypothetical protein
MKKLMAVVLPVKNFAAMIFTGLMTLYVVTGALFAAISGAYFDYTIPFAFVLRGLVLSLVISVLWAALFSGKHKSRAFIRIIAFAALLAVLVKFSAFTFLAVPALWAALWATVTAAVSLGLVIMAMLGEVYFRREGKRYTAALRELQANLRI